MSNREVVQQVFEDVAPRYDQEVAFFATFGTAVVHWAALRPGQRVLDLAAGRGAIAGPAAAAVGPDGEVLAVDTSAAMLRALRTDHPGAAHLRTQVMDAHRLEVPDEVFDVVTCGFTLHFLDDPALAIGETFRVLRPGGRLVFSGPPSGPIPEDPEPVPGDWSFFGALVREMAERDHPDKLPDPFTPPPRPLVQLCREAGYHDVTQHIERRTFTFDDPEHYWRWQLSHGFAGFVTSLGPTLAAELCERLLAELQRLHDDDGIVVRSAIAFVAATKPAAGG